MDAKDKEKAQQILDHLAKMQEALAKALSQATIESEPEPVEQQKKSSVIDLQRQIDELSKQIHPHYKGAVESGIRENSKIQHALGTVETADLSPTKPAVKSHVTEPAKTVTIKKIGKAGTRSSPSNPINRTRKTTRPKSYGAPRVTSSGKPKPRPTKTTTKSTSPKVKCKICGKKVNNIGELTRHRAKAHPQAMKRSAKKGASTRKGAQSQRSKAVTQGGINVEAYIGKAIADGQKRRAT